MAYVRKTRDYWDIEQQTLEGWEVVTSEVTRTDSRRSLREYRENQPEYPVRAVKRREKIETQGAAA
jgi:hypothetical protein